MKTTELQINDWVMCEGEPRRITGLDENFVYFEKGCTECHNVTSIAGIPLTRELLGLNGWFYPGPGGWTKLDCPERQLWGCLHTDGALWLYASGDCDKDESFAEIHYVHELQHALRLCGIEKKIIG